MWRCFTEGATCTAGMLGINPQDPCDNRLGLSCQPLDTANPTMGSACQATYVAANGMPCGMAPDGSVMHNYVCSDYSYCDTTSVCQPKVMEGARVRDQRLLPALCVHGGHLPGPDGAGGSPVQPRDYGRGQRARVRATPGGLPLICSTGTACCLGTPSPTDTSHAAITCSTGSSCPTSVNSELDCDDSSQCSSGKLCCLQYNPTNTPPGPAREGACTLSTACTGNNFEICRTDGAAPVVEVRAPRASRTSRSRTVCLPAGRRRLLQGPAPTCVRSQRRLWCGANANCCSGDCDFSISPHENLCF